MLNESLIKNLVQAYVMSQYLSDFCRQVGAENYINSVIRSEHGTGTGFFGISNTGSTDCIKERFRAVTDALGQKFDCWQQIDFVSESCIGMTQRDTNLHRVEHTRDVINLFKDFEQEYIIPGKKFSPADLGTWIIENQVVCLILQSEQLPKKYYNDAYPFSKYSTKIFFQGTDISGYDLAQIININKTRFASIITELHKFNFLSMVKEQTTLLLETKKKHTLPPIELAIRFHNDQYSLLREHYHHKLEKRTDPNDKKWYNKKDADDYYRWANTSV